MFPEYAERSFLDPEYSFDKYSQLGSRRKVGPIKNGLNGSEAPFVSVCQNASKCVIRAVHKTGSWVPLLHATCKQIVTSEAVGVLSAHKKVLGPAMGQVHHCQVDH